MIFKLLTLSEASKIYLPHYKVLKDAHKGNLLKYCLEKQSLKDYIPDKEKYSEITREFLLTVRIIFYSKADFC